MAPLLVGLIFAAILRIAVLYDGNHDGIEEGVGAGIPVFVGVGSAAKVGLTNAVSEVFFDVAPGQWPVEAIVSPTRPFFSWVCTGSKTVDEPEETLIIHCRERFFLRLPFLGES